MLRTVGKEEDQEYHRIVGLDLSLTKTAVLVLDWQGEVLFATEVGHPLELKARVKDKVERLLTIAKTVVRVIDNHSFEVTRRGETKTTVCRPEVVIEGYAFSVAGGGNKKKGNKPQRPVAGKAFDLGELGGVVKTQIWLRFAIEPVIIAPNTARKAVFGSGRTKKKDVLPLLQKKGLSFTSGDIADAYVVAECRRLQQQEEKRR